MHSKGHMRYDLPNIPLKFKGTLWGNSQSIQNKEQQAYVCKGHVTQLGNGRLIQPTWLIPAYMVISSTLLKKLLLCVFCSRICEKTLQILSLRDVCYCVCECVCVCERQRERMFLPPCMTKSTEMYLFLPSVEYFSAT